MRRDESRELNAILDTNLDYYEYLLARYLNDTTVDLRSDWEAQWRGTRQGMYNTMDSDLLPSAHVNAIKSVIDTLVSTIAEQKVRPFFNSVHGTFDTKKVVSSVQQFFDILFDDQKVHDKIVQAFRCACIMGKAYIYINPFTHEIRYEPAQNIAILNSEMRYTSTPTKMLLRYINYPTDRLAEYGISGYSGTARQVNLRHYIDCVAHIQRIYINNSLYKEHEYTHDVLPIVQLYYDTPVFGDHTHSIVEELEGIQTQIDYINEQLSTAAQLSPANQTFVIEGSSLNPKDLVNKAGMTYGIKMPAGVNTPPVVSVTPRLFDPQWLELQQWYLKTAYEIIGISELSAQSKKPTGLDSGVALQTMQNIESDRFQTQMDHYIQAYVDVAQTFMKVVDPQDTVLPDSINVSHITWAEVLQQQSVFKVQYSAATALSKDPAEKLKQVMQLTQVGLIGPEKVSTYLDMPDLEDAYADAAAVADGVSTCISRALYEEDYDIPDWVSYQLLAQQITIVENQLYATTNEHTLTYLKRLRTLEEHLVAVMEQNGYVDTQAAITPTTSESGIGIQAPSVQVGDVTQTAQAIENDTQALGTADVVPTT